MTDKSKLLAEGRSVVRAAAKVERRKSRKEQAPKESSAGDVFMRLMAEADVSHLKSKYPNAEPWVYEVAEKLASATQAVQQASSLTHESGSMASDKIVKREGMALASLLQSIGVQLSRKTFQHLHLLLDPDMR